MSNSIEILDEFISFCKNHSPLLVLSTGFDELETSLRNSVRSNLERLKYQDNWLSNGIYFRTHEYVQHCNEEDNKLNIAKMKVARYESEMLCGHQGRYVVDSGEGTSFCLMCAYENQALRKGSET